MLFHIHTYRAEIMQNRPENQESMVYPSFPIYNSCFARKEAVMSQKEEIQPSGDQSPFQELAQSTSREDFIVAVQQEAGKILLSLHIEEERFEEILEAVFITNYMLF